MLLPPLSLENPKNYQSLFGEKANTFCSLSAMMTQKSEVVLKVKDDAKVKAIAEDERERSMAARENVKFRKDDRFNESNCESMH